MKKDFKKWNEIKEKINDKNIHLPNFKEGDIWWTHYGANVGFEQDGKGDDFKRPVLVVKKFSRNLCWVIPLSSQVSCGNYFFPLISKTDIIRIAALHQMRLFDVKRFEEKCDSVSLQELNWVKEKITAFLR